VADGLDAAQVAARARAGDTAAQRAWLSFGEDLAWACEALITIVDPQRIVIGGSLANAGDLYRPALQSLLARHPTRIVDAELGPSAGVVGAAALNIG
jgi:glucokinase